MKKLLGILFLLGMFCVPSFADDYSTVCASHILVPTELDAIKLKSEINTYADFQKFASMYSSCPSGKNGGSLGCFGRGQMVRPFEKAAFEGEVGTVSDPVKTQFGYHLIWVTKKF